MPKRKTLTHIERIHIGELREAGWTFGMIAREIGCTEASARKCCAKLCIARKRAHGPNRGFRDGHPIARYAPSENSRILAARSCGRRYADVARELSRPVYSVIGQLYALGNQAAVSHG